MYPFTFPLLSTTSQLESEQTIFGKKSSINSSSCTFIKFDLSFSVPVEFSAHLIVDEINKLLSKNENEIEIFDDFQHENSRNLGIRIVTRSYEKTYDDNETRQILMKISDSLEAKFKITLNSGNND